MSLSTASVTRSVLLTRATPEPLAARQHQQTCQQQRDDDGHAGAVISCYGDQNAVEKRPLLYGILITVTGNDRAGMTVVIALLLAGLLVLPRR